MKSFAEIDLENNGDYIKLLSAIAKLSGLFSESSIPYINYRVAENIFCKSFNANNLSRSDTAYDASYNSIGIGLKTFTCSKNSSTEKIAEFNALSRELNLYKGKDLALKLAHFRNERIKLANRLYNIDNAMYHIVSRKDEELILFETDYDLIDIENIHSVVEKPTSLEFNDGKNLYRFNYSKSTLFRKFIIPDNSYRLPIEIIEDPYDLLLELFKDKSIIPEKGLKDEELNFVILPLYGIQNKSKFVFTKSGLNQWNAGGRKRDSGEVYIPIPSAIHKFYPNFFPDRDVEFILQIPNGEKFQAKVCQENSKALMTNPNKALSDWLLRTVLKLEEGELATIQHLEKLGFDSVIIEKVNELNYKIDIRPIDAYEEFIGN